VAAQPLGRAPIPPFQRFCAVSALPFAVRSLAPDHWRPPVLVVPRATPALQPQ
jgi:hypothetical protein